MSRQMILRRKVADGAGTILARRTMFASKWRLKGGDSRLRARSQRGFPTRRARGCESQDAEHVEDAGSDQSRPSEPGLRTAGGKHELGEQDGDRDTPHRVVAQRPLRPHPVDDECPTTEISRV